MPRESYLEIKVGIFVLVALLSLTVFIWSISDTSYFENGMNVKVVFNFANGLKKSAPVRIAGVEEGIVKDVSLIFDREDRKTKVEVVMWINKNTKVPADSSITINQLGLLGEKYIEIVPGVDTKNFFEEDRVFTGKDPIAQEAIAEKVLSVANKFEYSIAGVNRIINDENNIRSVGELLDNLSLVSGGLKDLIADVQSGQGTVGKLFYDDRLYDNIEGFTADLKANPWKLLYRPKDRAKK